MTSTLRRLAPALASLLLASTALAQGSNTCSTATGIAGTGTFPFSNVGATSDGPVACGSIANDVWFDWTAPSNDAFEVSTCGGASFDTVIAAYDGSSCVGPLLSCVDDSCGLQTSVVFNATAASIYKIRIGGFAGASGSGTFSVSVTVPPPPCGVDTGPDVIVGDITDVLNANPVGNLDAIALGTTSCNVGTALLNWISGTNDHPVIRQNLYRYKEVGGAGRFEQVGFSWLKHGFASLQGSLCCTCQPGGDGSHLGVGCSDPYGAGLNGSQPSLGPNWQVNAHTGVFTYPPANPTHGSDSIYRRCQVALLDLEATGGGNTTRFFGECQYVTKDDATAGNQNNNASWREASVSGSASNWNVGLIGSTHREEPAIRAWAQLDAAVNLDDVQVPGDGLVILGSRTTDLGGGQWRYEYAVFNLNADRNVGSVSVPIPSGVAVTNIGFHDVDYHDGDGPGNISFFGTDWPSTRGSGALSWACETMAQNASANAIRWGTQYNFRFDANAAPQPGSITLGLWKPAAPGTVVASGEVPGGGGGASVTSFCFGDGSGAPCPCGNSGAVGHGCENSLSTGGALMAGTGTPSLAADTLILSSSDERPTALTVFWQGSNETAGTAFGDGVACFNNPGLRRLYSKNAVGGTATAPQGAELSVSARSAATGDVLSTGDTRVYHAFYRDPDAAFCPPAAGSTFNSSNGLRVVWGP
jgi:hypothetical protein